MADCPTLSPFFFPRTFLPPPGLFVASTTEPSPVKSLQSLLGNEHMPALQLQGGMDPLFHCHFVLLHDALSGLPIER